jgi:hypothetical protein
MLKGSLGLNQLLSYPFFLHNTILFFLDHPRFLVNVLILHFLPAGHLFLEICLKFLVDRDLVLFLLEGFSFLDYV